MEKFNCLKCKYKFVNKNGAVQHGCPSCEHPYVKWFTYGEGKNSFYELKGRGYLTFQQAEALFGKAIGPRFPDQK